MIVAKIAVQWETNFKLLVGRIEGYMLRYTLLFDKTQTVCSKHAKSFIAMLISENGIKNESLFKGIINPHMYFKFNTIYASM